MTTLQQLASFETLCRNGASFEQALAETGLAGKQISMTAMIFKYWKFLEMEHAFNAAKVFYDQYLQLEEVR